MSSPPAVDEPLWVRARWLMNHGSSTTFQHGVEIDDSFLRDLGAKTINAFANGSEGPTLMEIFALIQYARLLENKGDDDDT